MRISVFGKAGFSTRQLLAITIITSGTLAWLFVIQNYFEYLFQSSLNSQFWLSIGETLFYGFGAFSAIVGVFLSSKVSRRKLLGLWTILGVTATGAIVAVPGLLFALILSALLGISLGLGLPCSMALLADSTKEEQRGRASGLLMLETFIMVFLAILAGMSLNLNLTEVVLVCITLRLTGFMGLLLDRCEKQKGKEQSWFSILGRRDFALYMFPWMMFNVASGLTAFVWLGLRASSVFDVAFQIGNTLQFAGTAIVCMISGFIADHFGRKQPIYIGVVLFAVSYAILGIATNETSVIIHLTTLGIAWGFLMVVYLTIPGDLANVHAQEKYYALATVLPLVVYSGLNALPKALGIPAPANILSPILSVVLFLSLVPVLYASETLSDAEIRKRKLKEHAQKVGKLVQEFKKPE